MSILEILISFFYALKGQKVGVIKIFYVFKKSLILIKAAFIW